MKYSGATLVQLRLQVAADAFKLEIADNGRGFDPRLTKGSHERCNGGHGLENMRWRMEQLGGKLDLISHPGRGTTVSLAPPDLM
jgi:signal transduction histidine kinase